VSGVHMIDTKTLLWITAVWAVAAYLIVPRLWARYYRRHPLLTRVARVTTTGDGHPGDPINIALAGSEGEVERAMTAAGWYPAKAITVESSVRIAADTVLHRSDDEAPVSNLFLFGRKQDLAYEQPIGGGPGKRHHVRFWRADELYGETLVWFGAATYDSSVGLSHTTGQVTHHIAPDVDAERDRLVAELQKAGFAEQVDWKDGFHKELEGKNGGGDPWHTDGRLAIVVLGHSSKPSN
jgi:hypothetical protein